MASINEDKSLDDKMMDTWMNSGTQTTTENGALSLDTTGSARIDFFFKTVRGTPVENLTKLLEASWAESPLDTLKLIFHLRDCRGGKGERNQFKECIKWLLTTGQHLAVLKNLPNFEFYGSYKDYLCLLDTTLESAMIAAYTRQLIADKQALLDNTTFAAQRLPVRPINITLAAKWAPTEGCSHDSKYKVVKKFANALRVDKKTYRKEYLVPLRKHLKIVERSMCADDWAAIDYASVPSVAMNRYRKIFEKHDETRFRQYLADVAIGKAKINASAVFPHEIVRPFLHNEAEDLALELQWDALVQDVKKKLGERGIKSAMSIVDVSGSMSGTPMEVAIALGLMLSEISEGPFYHKLLTFSSRPELFQVPHGSLKNKIKAIQGMHWDMNTDLQAAFDLLLDSAKLYSIPADKMPQTLFIFSDMQFDEACTNNRRTNFETIEAKYAASGYKRPKIVFWNLRGDTVDFPISKDVPNTALVSGFSPALMKLFVDGAELDPYQVMRAAIDDKRYDRVVL